MIRNLFAASLLGLGLAAVPAIAQETKTEEPVKATTTTTTTTSTGEKKEEKKPTDIISDSMEILDQEKRAIFTGNVNLKQPDLDWTADKMIIDYEETTNADGTTSTDAKLIDSAGNVKIVTDKETITGKWAKMDVKENKLKVGGNVKVVQDDTILYGELMDTDLDTDKTVMSGGRVKGEFRPK
jgi:lipopolysaccharide export system protein LptA